MSLARASRRYLWRHPWNLWLSVLGIGLGVAVVIAVNLANESARSAFRWSMDAVTGKASHSIAGGPAGVPEAQYVGLRLAPERWVAAPVVEATIELGERDLTLLGLDPLAEQPFRDAVGAIGDVPLARLLLEPGSVLMPRRLAAELALRPEDAFTVRIGGRHKSGRLIGVFDTDNPAAAQSLVLADLATAQEWLGRPGVLDRIDLILTPAQAARLGDSLPAGLRLERSASRNLSAERMTEAFRVNLTAMSLLALLVGGFIIYNTMTFSVLQRRPLFGNLRVLGATRQELFRLILSEALVLGAVGTLLGLAAGSLIAQGLVQLVTRTINDLYFTLNVSRFFVDPWVLFQGSVLGVGATLAAALVPAWEAARSEPRDVQRRRRVEVRSRRRLPRLGAVGALALAAGYGLAEIPGQGLVSAFAALFLVIVGFSLCVPLLLVGLAALLEPLMCRLAPPLGRLSLRGVTRALSRTGPAVAALTVAVSATVGVGIMIESFRATVALWLDQTLTSDIYLSAPSAVSNRAAGALDPAIPDLVAPLPGIRSMSRGRSVRIDTEFGATELLAIRMAAHSRAGFRFKTPPLDKIWPRFDAGTTLLVSEPFAYRHGVGTGDRLRLFTAAEGWRDFTVGGVYFDYGSDQGKLVMHQPTYAALWNDPALSALGIKLDDAADPVKVLASIRAALAPVEQTFRLRPTGELRAHSLAVFDRTFAVTDVLRLLSVGVAFIGILSALLALHLERGRDYALLRASGATPGQLAVLVTLQSTLLGLAAGLLALPLGRLMADLLIHVINLRSFGWTMQTYVPLATLVRALALATTAAIMAGLYPAWRAATSQPADALREE